MRPIEPRIRRLEEAAPDDVDDVRSRLIGRKTVTLDFDAVRAALRKRGIAFDYAKSNLCQSIRVGP